MTLDIVAIGHLINETIVRPAKKMRSVLGSPVAYSMACAAALGKHVGIVSRIGVDYPERLLEPLIELGIDTEGVVRQGGLSTNNQLVYDTNGNKTIRYLSRAPDVQFADVPNSYRDVPESYIFVRWIGICSRTSSKRWRSCRDCWRSIWEASAVHSPLTEVPQIKHATLTRCGR